MASDSSLTFLPLLSEKHLPQRISGDLVAYCDPHDLVAVATDSHDVVVYRISGETAFTVRRKDDEAEVTTVAWKPDGSLLAVGWSDRTYSLHSGDNGKLMSQGSVRNGKTPNAWRLDLAPDYGDDDDEEGGPVINRIVWTLHRSRKVTETEDENSAIEALLGSEKWLGSPVEDSESREFPPNGYRTTDSSRTVSKLARTITTLDVTTALPRLSPIHSHGLRLGQGDSRFASQSAVDGIFKTTRDAISGDVDSLLICTSDGHVQILQDDSVKIGSCALGSQPVLHASHAQSAVHAVLCRRQSGVLVSNFIDLPLESLGGPLLHVVALNAKRIQNLVAYITQAVRYIQQNLDIGLQFPSRLLNNLNAELADKEEGNAVVNFYHLAMTGDFTPTMKEWLVDIVKDTNHKRWDQAANGMYINIQDHIFFNLLPALNLLSIATSTLRGHARLHEGTSKFDVSPTLFTKMLDGIDSLRLVTQKVQLIVISEHRQFRAFSNWLKAMVEVGTAGPGSRSAIETEEREVPNLDYPLLLDYIKDTMTSSRLTRFVEQKADMKGSCSKEAFFEQPAVKQMGYEKTKGALERLDKLNHEGKPEHEDLGHVEMLLNMPTIAVYLAGNAKVAIERITEWQSKTLAKPSSMDVDGPPDADVLDMQTVFQGETGKEAIVTKLLLVPPQKKQQLILNSITSPGSHNNVQAAANTPIVIDINHDILDAKFHGPDICLVLVKDDAAGTHSIVRISFAATGQVAEEFPIHVFTAESGFRPEKLLVGGRSSKAVCLVLGNDGQQWKALDLDAKEADVGAFKADYVMGDD